MVKTLARQVELLQGGTHRGSPQPGNSASLVMNVEDMKSKTTRLIEHIDQHDRQLNALTPLLQRAQEIEAQLEYWQHRLPRRSPGEDLEEIQSSIELQEEFQQFKRSNRDRMQELRHAIAHPDAKMNILRSRSPTDTWEVVSDRVASEGRRVSATLSERVAEVERAMQTHSIHLRQHHLIRTGLSRRTSRDLALRLK